RNALMVDEPLGLQLVEHTAQFAGLCFMRAELALEFGAGVFAAAEQAQSPPLQRELRPLHPAYSASASAASSGMPSESRTLFSILTLVSLPIASSPFLIVPVRRMSRRTEA